MTRAALESAVSSAANKDVLDVTVLVTSSLIKHVVLTDGALMRSPTLTDLLAYEHPDTYKLYEQNYPNNRLPAKIAFKEVLKYLWLANKHEMDLNNTPNDSTIPPRCIMLRSMREIDEMWHEFILFTHDYVQFCDTYFGRYMHHLPNIFDTMPRSRAELMSEIELLLPYIQRHLGDETIKIWFADYL